MPRVGWLIEAFEEVLDLGVAVPLSALASHHHVDIAAAAPGSDEPFAPIESGGLLAHLGRIWLDLY